MNKLKAITRSVSFSPSASTSHKNNRNEKDKMEAVVGFKLLLHDEACGMFKLSFPNFLVFLIF